MPFVAECVFCRQKVRVPDGAHGSSVECPRCASYFTLVPADQSARAVKRHVEMPVVAPPAAVTTTADPESPQPAPVAHRVAIVSADESAGATTGKRGVDPTGLAALLLGGAALLMASSSYTGAFVIPAAALAALTGLAGLFVGLTSPKPRWVLSAAGSAVAAGVLLVAWVSPGMLGPAYDRSRQPVQGPLPVARAVPLPGQSAAAPADGDWADATRFALQVGDVRVQVVGAEVRPVEVQSGGRTRWTKEPYLVIHLRAHRQGGAREFSDNQWDQSGPVAQTAKPTLADLAGKQYALASLELRDVTAHKLNSTFFPVGVVDEVFVFEPPPTNVDALRLELAAEAWGGSGSLKFTLPREMIRAGRTAPKR